MTPSELAEYRWKGTLDGPFLPSRPLSINGCLLVSGPWSHLIDENTRGLEICYGVLVPEEAVKILDGLDIPHSVGTSVRFVGEATFVCNVSQTGYPALPWRMTLVYEFTYRDEYVGEHKFKLHDIPRDLYIKVPDVLSAQQIAAIKKHTERRLTVMELKKKLVPGTVVPMSRELNEEQQLSAKSELEHVGVEVILRHVARGKDWSEQAKLLL